MIFPNGKVDLNITATLDIDQRLVASPPDQESLGKILLPRGRIVLTPAVTVMDFQPGHELGSALSAGQRQTVHHASGYARRRQQHCGDIDKLGVA